MEDNDRVKAKFRELLEKGTVKGRIDGPTANVLICDSMADWCLATGELVKMGFDVCSPGGYGGSHPVSRQTTHHRLWRSGKICGVQFTENKQPMTFLFGLFREEVQPFLDIVTNRS